MNGDRGRRWLAFINIRIKADAVERGGGGGVREDEEGDADEQSQERESEWVFSFFEEGLNYSCRHMCD